MADYIGLRISKWRTTAGLTQQQLADRVGVSGPYIAMIEGGKRAVTKRSLIIALATALGVRVEDLTAQPRQPRDASELAVYSAAPGIRRALDEDPDGPLPDVDDVVRRAQEVMRARMACDYVAYAAMLPGLVTDTRQLARVAATERQGLSLFVRVAFAGAVGLKSLGHVDLSMRLAERAQLAAGQLGEPDEIAAANFATAQVALTGGSQRRSLTLAATAAEQVGDTATGDMASWYGLLHLHAAISAAGLGRSDDAATHYAEADDALRRANGPDRWRMEFSPANVTTWQVAIALENGEPERAPEYARRVDRTALRASQRRARLHIDAGRGHYLAGDSERAVRQFLAADDISAQELRSRTQVREITGQMVRDARRRGSDELRDLAVRLGIDPLDPDNS
ncbi:MULTISPECIES: helix-turn-helix transcriptional regulator [Micromonospora]|uniref:Helix-turn-helix domain-containing protein n=1 Tax=Micromonospora yangpuensis TaxID=683228 RepID=A0A1C6V3Y4_9ACTN|nr:helix-turn-helix transcriptional regulator [Micromonospora yangpuensis]GGM15265.1 transcriptional regulator [Micromonospora yangpuensis]SCL60948.1 Helix-turn-helix domain-containing protein [Micromonospora yangpuensis]